jgi:hypothetical protein
MLNSRRRLLTIVLAVGGLTMLGTGGAWAAADGAAPHHQPGPAAVAAPTTGSTQANPPEGGEAPGPTHPFCEGGSPLMGTPFCPSKWPSS